jgi:AAA+ superfamily predicted ATPase
MSYRSVSLHIAKSGKASNYKESHEDLTLRDLLSAFPEATAPEPIPDDLLDVKLGDLSITFLKPLPHFVAVGLQPMLGVIKRREKQAAPALEPKPAAPATFPETLDDRDAVELVYAEDLKRIGAYLAADLSVLVECRKGLAGHVYERAVRGEAKRVPVLDSKPVEAGAPGDLAPAPPQEMSPSAARLDALLGNLHDNETMVLAHVDLVTAGPEQNLRDDARQIAEVLFRHPKASLLALVDPNLRIPPILASRFPVQIALRDLQREVAIGDAQARTLELITLRGERDRCPDFDADTLFKHVSGFDPVTYRDAMRFVMASRRGPVPLAVLLDELGIFKRGGGQDVQIPDVTFDQIGGYEEVTAELRQIADLVSGRIRIPEAMRRKLVPRGLLLHGPPGTGKTLMAKALAHEMQATIQVVSGPEVMDMYVGESERKIRGIFATARRNAPSVVVFDEFDAIAAQRTEMADGGARAGNAVVAQLLTELDGFRDDHDVLVVATTNRPDIIDEALLRPSRFRPVQVGLPDVAARLAIARIHAREYELQGKLPEGALELLAEYSDDLNGDEIRGVLQEVAAMHFIKQRELDLALLGEHVGRMMERREQRRRRHLTTTRRRESAEPEAGDTPTDARRS